ncbi:MAG: hypothetical protein NTZ50_02785 [Chloroflexi bacterium]|nr:hypothetical protein [Chloroflexota bacterium]
MADDPICGNRKYCGWPRFIANAMSALLLAVVAVLFLAAYPGIGICGLPAWLLLLLCCS